MIKIFASFPLEDLWRIVATEFEVSDGFIDVEGVPTFILPSDQETKEPFKRLLKKLKIYNLLAVMRYASIDSVYTSQQYYSSKPGEKVIVLRVFPAGEMKKRNTLINVALFVVTTITIFFAGYQFANELNISMLLLFLFFGVPLTSYQPPEVNALYYTLAIYGVIGLHEAAHYAVSRIRGVEASLPYFIPGWPFGTFGALIMQEQPLTNRDELFDVGFSGPITSLVMAIIVAIAGIYMAPIIPWPILIEIESFSRARGIQLLTPWPTPLLYDLLREIVPKPTYGVELMHPLLWAAWTGMLIVALNLFPIGQLDGGHCARAVLSMKNHYIASIISAVVMALLGYFPMALLALLLSIRGHPGPLDDVSEASNSRKVGFILCLILAILSIPPLTLTLF